MVPSGLWRASYFASRAYYDSVMTTMTRYQLDRYDLPST
jgi:hypothetical protein